MGRTQPNSPDFGVLLQRPNLGEFRQEPWYFCDTYSNLMPVVIVYRFPQKMGKQKCLPYRKCRLVPYNSLFGLAVR